MVQNMPIERVRVDLTKQFEIYSKLIPGISEHMFREKVKSLTIDHLERL